MHLNQLMEIDPQVHIENLKISKIQAIKVTKINKKHLKTIKLFNRNNFVKPKAKVNFVNMKK